MIAEQSPAKVKKKRERSPAYPGINLPEAIDRARQMYAEEKKHSASVNTIFGHWGYSPNNSDGSVVLSALKKFGLLTDEGSGDKRKGRLTDQAVAILIDDREDSPERLKLIQEAALKPSVHQELWEKYGSQLPSDANLKFELRNEMHFSERGAKELMEQYRRTIQFAKFTEDDKLLEQSDDKQEDRSVTPPGSITAAKERDSKPADPKPRRVIALPIGQEWAVLEAAFPITKDEWDQMLAVLEAMKPGLVREKSPGPAAKTD